MMNKTMMIAILRADRTASGLLFRLITVWKHIYDHHPEKRMLLLTNSTLWERVFPGTSPRDYKGVYCFDDRKGYKLKAPLLWLWALGIIVANRVKTIHSSAFIFLLPLLYVKRLFRFSNCVTIGSNSVEMASTYNKRAFKDWDRFLKQSDAVDILNPTHHLHHYRCRKFISPCSFPFFLIKEDNRRLNFEQEERQEHILFVGSFIDTKNPLLAVDAFEHLLRDRDPGRKKPSLILFGKGPLQPRIAGRAEELNRHYGYEAVQLIADDKQIYTYLASSKVFLSIQNLDNYPSQSLMEAMLFCNSIIATDFGDTRLMVKESDGNYLLPEKDPVQLARLMADSLDNWRLNRANRQFILTHHTIERFAGYLLDIHEALAARP